MKFGEAFKQTLSIAGVDGTLRKRMVGTYAENNLCAKTGTLRNTSALSGYAFTKDGDQVVFSIINNGPNVSNFKQLENRFEGLENKFIGLESRLDTKFDALESRIDAKIDSLIAQFNEFKMELRLEIQVAIHKSMKWSIGLLAFIITFLKALEMLLAK